MLSVQDPVAAAVAREDLLPPDLRGGVASRTTTVEALGGHNVAVHRWGLSRQPGRSGIRYDDWRRVVHDLLVAERERSGRRVVAFGASLGGRLAYEATATSGVPSWLVVTNLLEPTDPAVRPSLTRWRWMGQLPVGLLGVGGRLGDRLPVPMRWVARMNTIANDPRWVRALLADRSASGAWMPLGFLRTLLTTPVAVEPEAFTTCPVTLTQPGDDRWTPLADSLPLFGRLTAVPTSIVTLERCGHLPLEEPGRQELARVIVDALRHAAGAEGV